MYFCTCFHHHACDVQVDLSASDQWAQLGHAGYEITAGSFHTHPRVRVAGLDGEGLSQSQPPDRASPQCLDHTKRGCNQGLK